MNRLAIIAALALCASPVLAAEPPAPQDYTAGQYTVYPVQKPPARWTASAWANGVQFTAPERTNELCGNKDPNVSVNACTTQSKGIMILPNPCAYPGDYYAKIVCHEMAHLNGWNHGDR